MTEIQSELSSRESTVGVPFFWDDVADDCRLRVTFPLLFSFLGVESGGGCHKLDQCRIVTRKAMPERTVSLCMVRRGGTPPSNRSFDLATLAIVPDRCWRLNLRIELTAERAYIGAC